MATNKRGAYAPDTKENLVNSKEFLKEFLSGSGMDSVQIGYFEDVIEEYAEKLDELVADEVATELELEQRSNL